jgi:hypothetical protein
MLADGRSAIQRFRGVGRAFVSKIIPVHLALFRLFSAPSAMIVDIAKHCWLIGEADFG